jgi:MFS family permease
MLTPAAQRPRSVALYQTVVFTAAVCGPLLGGWIADTIDFRMIFFISGGGRFVGMLIFLAMSSRVVKHHRQSG